MLCEKCHKREATVHTVQVINGEKIEHYYCEECAKLYDFENPISFQDIFQSLLNYGLGSKQEEHSNTYRSSTVKCPNCGMTYEELRRSGKFGCSSCYAAFEPYITGSLKSIHGDNTHKGKAPKRNGGPLIKKHELDELRRKLAEAIANEEYEEAAVLRDRIKSLEGDDKHE
ncbi:MAG: UvrB/UvrC motif-containing protein [Candidatus Metalachnospira sp.]|nr:UvrB/UvrC motif-containing protein [Candidatus Metalachnospira sp.]